MYSKIDIRKIINVFTLTGILFILTLLSGKAANQEEWSPKLYGHFFPIFQDGVNSLSIRLDLLRFIIEFSIFLFIIGTFINFFKLKFTKFWTLFISVIFLLIVSIFIMILSIDFNFTKMQYSFDYSTLQLMWLSKY